jgi:hypothetical protein
MKGHAMTDFSGHWLATFGPLDLRQKRGRVTGAYPSGSIDGHVDGNRLTFRYREPTVEGDGWFELRRPDKLLGKWRPDGTTGWGEWSGERGFEGIWNSSFGPLRLVQEAENRVLGFYEGLGPATVEGKRRGNRLTLHYQEPKAAGKAVFELSKDGMAFEGEWQQDGLAGWRPWLGKRLLAQPGLTWLVVIEAHWQRFLADREYSFGGMLNEFFARLSHVHVRHRFFTNEEGLRHWCRDLMYLPEPTVVLVATHGSPKGLAVHHQIISPATIIESVRYADSIRLLHFSSCLMMQKGRARDTMMGLQDLSRFPVSGYTTSVDWATSAIIEFTYLDLILGRSLPPAEAAGQLVQLLPFAGATAPDGSVYPAAGFQILTSTTG